MGRIGNDDDPVGSARQAKSLKEFIPDPGTVDEERMQEPTGEEATQGSAVHGVEPCLESADAFAITVSEVWPEERGKCVKPPAIAAYRSKQC